MSRSSSIIRNSISIFLCFDEVAWADFVFFGFCFFPFCRKIFTFQKYEHVHIPNVKSCLVSVSADYGVSTKVIPKRVILVKLFVYYLYIFCLLYGFLYEIVDLLTSFHKIKKMSTGGEKGSSTTKTPADFLKSIRGRPVVVKLNSGVDYRGQCLYFTIFPLSCICHLFFVWILKYSFPFVYIRVWGYVPYWCFFHVVLKVINLIANYRCVFECLATKLTHLHYY